MAAPPLSREALWLGRPPAVSGREPAIHPQAWALLCLACFGGMDAGKRSLGAAAMRTRDARGGGVQTDELAAAVHSASEAAVCEFWAVLAKANHWRPKKPWADALRTCGMFSVEGGDTERGPYSRATITLRRPADGLHMMEA